MRVIAVTHSQDGVAGTVLDELRRRGVEALRFETDRFPAEVGLRRWMGDGKAYTELCVDNIWTRVAPEDAVWWRRLRVASALDPEVGAQMIDAAIEESRIALFSWVGAHHGLVVDRPRLVRAAREKMLQLTLAAELGLDVLPTLVTNDPEAVRRFWDEQQGELITKMEHAFAIEQGDRVGLVHTSRVRPEDLDALDGLSACPMTFQRRVRTVREYRATVVGPRVLTGVLDYAAGDYGTDWRLASLTDEGVARAWRPGALPAGVEAGLLALMDRLGLCYGAADLLEDAEGRFWFLEVNPSGEWGWLNGPGLPIASALADLLMGEMAARNVVYPRV